MKRMGFWKVTVLAALVLLVETVLFHVVSYLFDYFFATGVISYAVLGIGLGAFAASHMDPDEDALFLTCILGATIALYSTAFILVWYPVKWLIGTGIALVFVFPVLYLSMIFRRYPADRVYLFDMAGAGLGVMVTVMFYEMLRSESIILLIVTLLPLLSLFGVIRSATLGKRTKVVGVALTIPLILLGGTLFGLQVSRDTFNVVKILNRNAPYHQGKMFKTKHPERLVKSYDSLIGRMDVFKAEGNKHNVSYNGYVNDHFRSKVYKTYEYYKKKNIKWPTGDRRVLYGLVEDPKIFIIGSAARGIIPTAKKITPVENIYAVEIDPAILDIMQRDFYEASGMAYRGLKPILGNALAILKSLERKFDIITLINTHSGRTIGYKSGPDYLHTRESYNLFLEHLNDNGYILFEERPFTREGILGTYRMINTMWQTLRERGVKDPSKHFFLWEWEVKRRAKNPSIDLRMDKKERFRKREGYYIGMIVTREPLVGPLRDKLLAWYRDGIRTSRMAYLKNHVELGEIGELFTMLEKGDLSPLVESDNFDPSILTNDKPFASLARQSVPEVTSLLTTSAIICSILGVAFLLGTAWGANKGRTLVLGLYNILIGFGYFLIEIMQLQVYQNVFVSPSSTLILVLGLLLISSGVGGLFTSRIQNWIAAAGLMPVALLSVFLPGLLLEAGFPSILAKILSVGLICLSGFLMGVFFPRGLQLAGIWDLRKKIPYLFAINSVAGSFAVILALNSAVQIGYSSTIILALGCYTLAALILGNPAEKAS